MGAAGDGDGDGDFDLVDCRVVAVETEAAIEALEALAACMKRKGSGDGDDTCKLLVSVGAMIFGCFFGMKNLRFDVRETGFPFAQIHLGVQKTLQGFQLERCAVNEANFRIPDAAGRQLKKEAICVEDGGVEESITTHLPLDVIATRLEDLGHPCNLSDDAGRFLCNYIYYHSLKLSASMNGKQGKQMGRGNTASLFVHVPPFTTIAQPQQEKFLADLLKTIAAHNDALGVERQ